MSSSDKQNDLVGRFERAATAAAATVERMPRLADALGEALRRATSGASRVLLAEPDALPWELLESFRQRSDLIIQPTEKELSSFDIEITDALAGVARTGSVRVFVGLKLGGPAACSHARTLRFSWMVL